MDFPLILIGPGLSLRIDPAAREGGSGSAQFALRPTLSSVHTAGHWVEPVLGATTDRGLYLSAHNCAWGRASSPIPRGTMGQASCYEANLDSAQDASDQAPGESGHAFGCTVVSRGGATLNPCDFVIQITGVPGSTLGVNVSVINDAGGGQQHGFTSRSAGRYPGYAAYAVEGPWTVALDAAGRPLYRVSFVEFAGADGHNTGWGIDGSRADGLRITMRGQSVARIDPAGNLHLNGKVVQGL